MTKLFSLKNPPLENWSLWSLPQYECYVGPDRFVVHDVFLSVFWWIYCYNIGWAKAHVPVWMFWPLWAFFSIGVCSCEHTPILSTHIGVSSVHTLMWAHTDTQEGPIARRLKRLDGNVCSFPPYIATINPPKDTENHIVDDEVVQSNINLLTNNPIEDKPLRLRDADVCC